MTSIVIDLDEGEMQQIVAILVENYIETNLIPSQNGCFIKYVKKVATSVGRFAGIMFSLVGANILTKMYEHTTSPAITIATNSLDDSNTSIMEEINEICNHIYGCDDGRCWRTCNEKKNELSKTICFMSIISTSTKDKCVTSDDCTPCSECISECKVTI